MKNKIFTRLTFFLLLVGVLAVCRFGASTVWAQSSEVPSDVPGLKRLFSANDRADIAKKATSVGTTGWRKDGSGNYFSATKLGLLLLVFWLWVATTGWANCDGERLGDANRVQWNTALFAIFPGAFLIGVIIPIFWIGYPLIVLAWYIPLMVYVSHRNRPLLAADKVLTFEHIVYVTKRTFGMKVEPPKLSYELGSPIKLECSSKSLDKQGLLARTITARNLPGFNFFREILYNSLKRNAMGVNFTFDSDGMSVQYQIDGVWHPIEGLFKKPLQPEDIESIREAAKLISGVNSEDTRNRQAGQFRIEYDKKMKVDAEFMVAPNNQGEQFAIRYLLTKIPYTNLDQIGMYPDRQVKFRSLLNAENGVFVISAVGGQGLKTITNVAFNVADRFTRDFATVEDVNRLYHGIENVSLNTYDSSKGQKPIDILPDVFFREPKVVLLRDLGNTEALTLCCQEVENDRLIITTFRGKDSVDTLMKLLATGIEPALLAKTLVGIVTQKLIRLLCEDCKEEIEANPQMLQRLGIKPDDVEDGIYRKRVRPEVPPGQKDTYVPCEECHEIGYFGRTAIFDFLEMTDELRDLITKGANEAAIRQAVAKSGQRGYLVDGAKLIADGFTSFDELGRILKQ